MPGGRGTANFVMNFKGGGSLCSVNILSSNVEDIEADELAQDMVTLCELECRGCEVVSWRS